MATCKTITLPPKCERWGVRCLQSGLEQVLCVLILIAKEFQKDGVHICRGKLLQ